MASLRFLGVVLLCICQAYHVSTMADSKITMEPSTDALRVTLTNATEPTVLVENTSATTTYTVLRRDAALDSAVVQLGLLAITPGGSSERFDVPRIMFKRVWPPVAEEFVVLKPGESASQRVTGLREPVVDIPALKKKGGGKASLKLEGQWSKVWVGAFEKWEDVPKDAELVQGSYESNVLEITVE